ncbi:MAG: hypothetical protein LBT26_04970 [Clostridiales Family XIII bacterium]|jgi:hypothetical protein|nr:hypothetical protein [Clostridiales Family XIII bacterium]
MREFIWIFIVVVFIVAGFGALIVQMLFSKRLERIKFVPTVCAFFLAGISLFVGNHFLYDISDSYYIPNEAAPLSAAPSYSDISADAFPLTRQDMLEMLVLWSDPGGAASVGEAFDFAGWAIDNRLLSEADADFTPGDPITQADFFLLLYRYCMAARPDAGTGDPLGLTFEDAEAWALENDLTPAIQPDEGLLYADADRIFQQADELVFSE